MSLYQKNLKHPSTIIVTGPTQCGKSTFTINLINNSEEIFSRKFDEVIYCLPNTQNFGKALNKSVRIFEGVPDLDIFSDNKNRILVLDDLMTQQNNDFIDLFTRISHHNNVTVIYLTQNLFNSKKGTRDITLNAHYIVFFKNPRDKNQISYLARQVFPENQKYLEEAFVDATLKPHGYLMLDLTQETGDDYRIRTNILPSDTPRNVFYVPLKRPHRK
jgi:tRNA U34 5-methylaminomethyl-2-thiouridine-forming methyltransferase MnmC